MAGVVRQWLAAHYKYVQSCLLFSSLSRSSPPPPLAATPPIVSTTHFASQDSPSSPLLFFFSVLYLPLFSLPLLSFPQRTILHSIPPPLAATPPKFSTTHNASQDLPSSRCHSSYRFHNAQCFPGLPPTCSLYRPWHGNRRACLKTATISSHGWPSHALQP